MGISVADQYYIKALEGYPYNLEESIENLDYALSYDSNHAGALHLMGCVCMEHLDDYEKAEDYFQMAFSINTNSVKVDCDYARLMINTEEFSKAKNLIEFLFRIKGADKASILRIESLLYEHKKQYDQAIDLLEDAKDESYNSEFTEALEIDLIRVKEKRKRKNRYRVNIA